MKCGKRFVACTIVCLTAVILCIAGLVSAEVGPNPGGEPPRDIIVGPPVKGVLIACWRCVANCEIAGEGVGKTDVFLVLDGNLYTGCINHLVETSPEQAFLNTTEPDVKTYPLPVKIATDFGVDGGVPFIRYDRDVTNFAIKQNVDQVSYPPYQVPLPSFYRHVLHCNVEIWFFKDR